MAIPDKILEEIRSAQEAGDVDGMHKLQKAAFEAILAQTGKRMIVIGGMPTKIAKAKPSPALYLNRPPRRKELRLAAQAAAAPPPVDEQDIVVKSETPGRPDVVVRRRRSSAAPAENAARPEPASVGERDIKPTKPAENAARPSNGKAPPATETDTNPETPAAKSGQRAKKKR